MGEDNAILSAYRKLKGKKDFSADKVAKEAHEKLTNHSEDAILGRLNAFFLGLPKAEEDKIVKAAKVLSCDSLE